MKWGTTVFYPELVPMPVPYLRRVYYPWWHWRAYSRQRWYLV